MWKATRDSSLHTLHYLSNWRSHCSSQASSACFHGTGYTVHFIYILNNCASFSYTQIHTDSWPMFMKVTKLIFTFHQQINLRKCTLQHLLHTSPLSPYSAAVGMLHFYFCKSVIGNNSFAYSTSYFKHLSRSLWNCVREQHSRFVSFPTILMCYKRHALLQVTDTQLLQQHCPWIHTHMETGMAYKCLAFSLRWKKSCHACIPNLFH